MKWINEIEYDSNKDTWKCVGCDEEYDNSLDAIQCENDEGSCSEAVLGYVPHDEDKG